MNKKWHIPRRTFLRGLGTAIALPMLEVMVPPVKLFAEGSPATAKLFPKRMAFIYVPNGANMVDWTPKEVGANFQLPTILEPLQPFQKDLLVFTGLAHDKARPHGDGTGDHARAAATFLTGCQARKTEGANIKLGISVDQMAAEKIGRQTRLSSLELRCDQYKSGTCDSNYACAYQNNISWKTESTPMSAEVDPRLVFERLFGVGGKAEVEENRERRQRYQKSILDFVLEDARQLKSNLGATDQRKLDEYLTAVRELEQRLEQAKKFESALPDYTKPSGIPYHNFPEHTRLMYDLLALAFQTDSTRISTLMISHDGSNRSYPNIGVPEGHHDLSHHGNDEQKKQKIAKINHFHIEQFAYFLKKLKSIKEGEGNLLDNSMIVYGSGISDGDRHNHDDLPVLLAGHAGGVINPGRHLKLEHETPMTNLFLSMLDIMGAPAERVGDSSGKLNGLA